MAKSKYRIEGEDATGAAFKSALGNAQKTATKMSGAFRAAFAGISVASFLNVGKASVAMGDDLSNAAKNAGITGSAMSELAYVAKQSDIEIAALGKSIKTMKVALSEAASGAKAPIANLRAIGLEIKDLRGLRADQQFEIIGDAISRLKDSSDRSRASLAFFGKAGDDIGRAFENGADGVRKLREEAIATGAALSDETIAQLADTDDEIKKLEASWAGFTARMTAEFAPQLRTAMDFWSGAPRTANEQIADLEDQLEDVVTTRGSSAETQRAAIRKRIAALREIAKQESMREMGIGESAPDKKAPPGFDDEAAEAEARHQERLHDMILDSDRDLRAQLNKSMEEDFDRNYEKWVTIEDKKREATEESQKALEEWRAEQAAAISENAQIFKDAFLNAWDDMANNGKFKIDELFKYILAEFARRGISKLFDTMFAGTGAVGGGGGGGLGGLFGGFGKAMGGLFGGGSSGGGMGFAQGEHDWMKIFGPKPGNYDIFGGLGKIFGFAGGGRPRPGVPYLVGEKGPELRVDDGPGTIFPSGSLGGGVSYAPVYNIDARGADIGLVQRLPRILEQSSRATEARIVDGLRRRRYNV